MLTTLFWIIRNLSTSGLLPEELASVWVGVWHWRWAHGPGKCRYSYTQPALLPYKYGREFKFITQFWWFKKEKNASVVSFWQSYEFPECAQYLNSQGSDNKSKFVQVLWLKMLMKCTKASSSSIISTLTRRLSIFFCLSSGGHFMNTAEKIRLPDDCTIGYIIESVLGVPLTRSNLFHSHLENLQQVSRSETHKQVRGWAPDRVWGRGCVWGWGFVHVAHVFAVFCPPDHSQLWDVWKQEQHHQFERGFFCGGRSITVRDSSAFKDVAQFFNTF